MKVRVLYPHELYLYLAQLVWFKDKSKVVFIPVVVALFETIVEDNDMNKNQEYPRSLVKHLRLLIPLPDPLEYFYTLFLVF
ncbi:hypothetical protein GYH30_003251 [Glycine max]|uniref:Uncharacterized protein n=2 Tax=Glycine subgen. Soja TaxID=1462606 RepID=A0A0R0KWR1_SOYBN|nr:hypothetical protein JHK87_003843 [Glycine soja]KAH1059103.1 hypothetical protein GYH30_003251 [Glycine max]RZC24746.1 hypothetical protein D0Y65_003778 [Glycine soja]